MNRIFKFFLLLSVAALSLAACKEKEHEVVEPVKYTISADTDFNADLKANIKVTASRAAEEDVTVVISRDETSTLPEANVSFPEKIDIKAGDKEASAEVVVLNPIALEPGEYKIVLSAAVGDEALADKVTINYGRPDLKGAWSIIGLIDWSTDIAMEEAEDGWYAAYEVEVGANAEFKFRKDADWTGAYGLDATAAVPVDGTEFDVNTKGGENTNLKIEVAGLYDIYLNPNKAKAKVELLTSEKVLKVTKLWEKLSTASASWTTTLSADGKTAAGSTDLNIAIDDKNVYVTEFGTSKNLWAIDILTGNNVKLVNTSNVEAVGFNGGDGSVALGCARVVKKNDGTPVLLATNVFQDGDETVNGRLYIWTDGIDSAPVVKKLDQYKAGRRLGDTFTTYGNYEDCWLIMGTQTGNGFVTFKVPTGEGSTSYLISRLAIDTADFCTYYPFPGDLLHGMFTWRGGDHDDGMAYRNRLMTVNSTEAAIKSAGAHTSSLEKLSTWMGNYENNNGSGFNYFEFNGKRYVAWVINMADKKTFDFIIKEGELTTSWQNIINTAGPLFRESLKGGMDVSWKQGTDCAVWNAGDEVYIAVNKINVGIAVYKMSLEFAIPEK